MNPVLPVRYFSKMVMAKAKQIGVKVMLDGQAGDETLLGYERYYMFLFKKMISQFRFNKLIKEYFLSQGIPNLI